MNVLSIRQGRRGAVAALAAAGMLALAVPHQPTAHAAAGWSHGNSVYYQAVPSGSGMHTVWADCYLSYKYNGSTSQDSGGINCHGNSLPTYAITNLTYRDNNEGNHVRYYVDFTANSIGINIGGLNVNTLSANYHVVIEVTPRGGVQTDERSCTSGACFFPF